MPADPALLATTQEFLQYFILGDSSGLNSPGQPPPVSSPGRRAVGSLSVASGPPVAAPVLSPLRRRRPAVQGTPDELLGLASDPGISDDPTTAVLDMCGVEDFVLLDGSDLTLVLFWCTDYPSTELNDLLPGLAASVRVVLPSTIETSAIMHECAEKLRWLLGDDYPELNLQYRVEYLPFEQLAQRKLDVLADPLP